MVHRLGICWIPVAGRQASVMKPLLPNACRLLGLWCVGPSRPLELLGLLSLCLLPGLRNVMKNSACTYSVRVVCMHDLGMLQTHTQYFELDPHVHDEFLKPQGLMLSGLGKPNRTS